MTAEDRLWEMSKFLEILYKERGYIKSSYCQQAFRHDLTTREPLGTLITKAAFKVGLLIPSKLTSPKRQR